MSGVPPGTRSARRAGEIGEVWLPVAPDNLPARGLYEKLGLPEAKTVACPIRSRGLPDDGLET
jgi:ribosomal protein S18 acetylase RimI-like enzyme